jgi:hypothetical protein
MNQRTIHGRGTRELRSDFLGFGHLFVTLNAHLENDFERGWLGFEVSHP